MSPDWRWWARWWSKHFLRLAYRRLRYCRKKHAGPMYDGWICLACYAPWFFYDDSEGEA